MLFILDLRFLEAVDIFLVNIHTFIVIFLKHSKLIYFFINNRSMVACERALDTFSYESEPTHACRMHVSLATLQPRDETGRNGEATVS